VVPIPNLASFDISWFDTTNSFYALADRSNAAIDVIPLSSPQLIVEQILPGAPLSASH